MTSTLFKSFLTGAKNLHQHQSVTKKTPVTGLTVGMYRTELLKKERGFDPKFWVNQDGELHYRLIKKGYKLLLIPNIKLTQAKRESLKKLIKQMFRYGRGAMLRFYKYPKSFPIIQFVPAIFTYYCAFTLISLINPGIFSKLLLGGLSLYILAGIFSTLLVTKNLFYIIVSPIFYLIMHIAYGTGTIVGIFKPQIKTSDR